MKRFSRAASARPAIQRRRSPPTRWRMPRRRCTVPAGRARQRRTFGSGASYEACDAGHILGSSAVVVTERDGSQTIQPGVFGRRGPPQSGHHQGSRRHAPGGLSDHGEHLWGPAAQGSDGGCGQAGRRCQPHLPARRQDHRPGVRGGPDAAARAAAPRAVRSAAHSAHSDFRRQSAGDRSDQDLPQARRVLRRRDSRVSRERRGSVRVQLPALRAGGERFQGAERSARALHDHLRFGHVRRRAHPASP